MQETSQLLNLEIYEQWNVTVTILVYFESTKNAGLSAIVKFMSRTESLNFSLSRVRVGLKFLHGVLGVFG